MHSEFIQVHPRILGCKHWRAAVRLCHWILKSDTCAVEQSKHTAGYILLLRVCNINWLKKSLFKRRRFNQHLRLNKVAVLELMLIRNASNSTHSVAG